MFHPLKSYMHLSKALMANYSFNLMLIIQLILPIRDPKLLNFVYVQYFICQSLLISLNFIFLFVLLFIIFLILLFISIQLLFIYHSFLQSKLNHLNQLLLHIPIYQMTAKEFRWNLFCSFNLLFISIQVILFYLYL